MVDLIKGERIQMIVNTPRGQDTFFDEKAIRRAAVLARIPRSRRWPHAKAAAEGIAALQQGRIEASSLCRNCMRNRPRVCLTAKGSAPHLQWTLSTGPNVRQRFARIRDRTSSADCVSDHRKRDPGPDEQSVAAHQTAPVDRCRRTYAKAFRRAAVLA